MGRGGLWQSGNVLKSSWRRSGGAARSYARGKKEGSQKYNKINYPLFIGCESGYNFGKVWRVLSFAILRQSLNDVNI